MVPSKAVGNAVSTTRGPETPESSGPYLMGRDATLPNGAPTSSAPAHVVQVGAYTIAITPPTTSASGSATSRQRPK